MSSAAPVRNPSPKRTRFADENGEILASSATSTIPPTMAAKNKIVSATATLPLAIQPQARNEAFKIIKQYAELQECLAKRSKFDSPDFIPRSARIKFNLVPPSDLRESAAVKLLVTETEAALQLWQSTVTAKLKALLDIEILDLRTKLDDAIIKFVCFLASMTAAYHDGTIKSTAAIFTLAWIGLSELNTATRIDGDEATIFAKCLQFIPVAAQDNVEFDMAACRHFADQANQTDAMQRVAALFKNQIQTIIIRSLLAHDEAKKQFAQSLKVQELIKKFTKTTATETVAMQLEREASADPETIKKLIANEVTRATKRLVTHQKNNKQMDSTDRKKSDTAKPRTKKSANNPQTAKNFKRGAPKGASIKKKSAQTTVSKAKIGRKSAANAADDSSNTSSKNMKMQSTGKHAKKKKTSSLKSKK